MRWLVTGAAGQVGHHVTRLLQGQGVDVVGLTRAEFDITDADTVSAVLEQHRPDVVVNTAAYTAVDAAETDEAAAHAVNGVGPGLLAAELDRRGGRLVHVSTDYVFDGTATRPYRPDDPTNPRTAYGRTKLSGELAVHDALPDRSVVVRTAWVYGGPGPNFVATMLRLQAEHPTLRVVSDQVGSPTWAVDLAAALIAVGARDDVVGTTHFANTGRASWFELTQQILSLAGADPARVEPIATADFPRPAPRPAWSVLSTAPWEDAGMGTPRSWQDALAECLAAR